MTRRFSIHPISIPIALAIFIGPVDAQTASPQWPQISDRGIIAAHTYDLTQVESIGLENGSLNLRIPLASLPPGPGGSSFGLELVYNSAVFDFDQGHYSYVPTAGGGPGGGGTADGTMTVNLVASTHGGGWNYGFQYAFALEAKSIANNPAAPVPCTQQDQFLNRLTVIFPDGSQHLLHLFGYTGDQGGYYQVDPSAWATVTPCGPTGIAAGSILTYYTDDGTFTRVKVVNGGAWTIYRPDGTSVQGSGFANSQVSTITDRNKNTFTFTYSTPNNTPQTTIKDSDGRTLTITNNLGNIEGGLIVTGATDTIIGPGANGVPLTWTVNLNQTASTTSLRYMCTQNFFNDTYSSCTTAPAVGAITSILLPMASGDAAVLEYIFSYNGGSSGGWGELSSMTMPSGATVSYTYDSAGLATQNIPHSSRPVVQKTLSYKDSTGNLQSQTWQYSNWVASGTQTLKTVTNPDGGPRKYYYTQYELPGDPVFAPQDPKVPRVDSIVEPNGDRVDRFWQQNCPYQIFNNQPGNPYVKAEYHTVASAPTAKMSTQIFGYDRNGNLLTKSICDFSSTTTPPGDGTAPTNSTLISQTTNTIDAAIATGFSINSSTGCGSSTVNSQNGGTEYWNPGAGPKLDSIASTQVSSGAVVGRSEFSYYPGGAATNGNVTSKTSWDSSVGSYNGPPLTTTNSVSTSFGYDSYGNVTSTTDANGVTTTLTFDQCGHSYPSKIVWAFITVTKGWDCSTGLLSSFTDANGIQSTQSYDTLGRVTAIDEAISSVVERTTAVTYQESSTTNNSTTATTVNVKKDLTTKGNPVLVTTTETDQLGQPALVERPDGSYVQHLTSVVVAADGATYEAVSNPYFSGDAISGWTRTKKDQLGRVVEVGHFSGPAQPKPWNSSGSSTPTDSVTTSYNGYISTVTDESGHSRQMTVDALGRLTNVVEDPGGLNYSTVYQYDAFGNLTNVTQGTQSRTFVYSSLSRLQSATNPESGTTNYTYDQNGNLLTKTDSRGVVTIYGVDDLDRVAAKQYSDGTPNVTYCFDGDQSGNHHVTRGMGGDLHNTTTTVSWSCAGAPATSNAIMRLTQSSTSVGATTTGYSEVDSYDALGQVTSSATNVNGVTRRFGQYTYNLAGTLTSMQYPSGRKVDYTVDSSNRYTGVKNDSDGYLYASGATYYAHGGLNSIGVGQVASGNTAAFTETHTYDFRQRQTQISVTGPVTRTIGYSYFSNGNPGTQTITGTGLSQNLTQTYAYDGVNRLISASENGGGTGWAQDFGYDKYGNRAVLTASTGYNPYIPSSALTPQAAFPATLGQTVSVPFNAITNRWTTLENAGAVDTAGNQTGQLCAGCGAATYDAENRIVSVASASSSVSPVRYYYDGDGRRTMKVVCAAGASSCDASTSGATITAYAHDAFGNLAAEYGGASPDSGRKFVFADALGSTRMYAAASGSPANCYDYLPFGEEIGHAYGGRGTSCYGSVSYPQTEDVAREKFTGKERDSETGLDYFEARYMSAAQGRFTSPDWSATPEPIPYADLKDPQTLNLYSYVRNNPMARVDVDGHVGCGFLWLGNCPDNASAPPPPPPPKPPTPQEVPGAIPTVTVPGPKYKTAESAAVGTLDKMNPQSQKETREYAARVFQNADGTFGATPPAPGTVADSVVPPEPEGTVGAAGAHTHPKAPGYDSEHVSAADQVVAAHDGQPHYVATPSGAILKIDPKNPFKQPVYVRKPQQ